MSGSNFWEELLMLVFPARSLCMICWRNYSRSSLDKVCADCREHILEQSRAYGSCSLCGRFKKPGSCPNCHDSGLPGLSGVVSAVPYEGQYREIIQNLKYGGRQDLSAPIGYLMSSRFSKVYPKLKPDIIVPVPLEPQRQLERGFNQSALLAEVIAKRLKVPAVEDILFRRSGRVSQTALGRTERIANTGESFYPAGKDAVKGKTVLLVDDIVTSGATLSACGTSLQSAGAQRVWGLTWAAGGHG